MAAACAIVALALGAGRAGAAASDYTGPLYLAGPPSLVAGSSYQMVPSASLMAAPTATVAGTGMIAAGDYYYVYTVVGATGETASAASAKTTLSSASTVTVGNLPTGVQVRVYRGNATTGTLYSRVWDSVSANASSTWTDNVGAPPATTNLKAENRIASYGVGAVPPACAATTCGWLDFQPGVSPVGTGTTPPTLTQSPLTTTATGKGWMVETAGPVTFAPGDWTFKVQTKLSSTNGVAQLAAGMWKATSGAPSTWVAILGPSSSWPTAETQGPWNMTSAAPGGLQTTTLTVTFASTVTLAAGEHLYVQFWRHQTGTTNTGAANRLASLLANDGVAQVIPPAADDAAPSISVTAPGASEHIRNGYTLQSNPTDPSPGSGIKKVDYYECAGAVTCNALTPWNLIGTASTAPWSFSWSGQPADGTYTLVAVATDKVDNATSSSATTVVVDNTPPDTAITSTPPSLSNTRSPSFGFSSEANATFECRLDSGGYSACPDPDTLSGVSDGSHTFYVRALDQAGNPDPSPASYTWTVDATAPTTTFSSTPNDPTNSTGATFAFTADDAAATFQCELDGGAFSLCSSGQSYSGLAAGSHTFQIKATDLAGNSSTRSFTWTIDLTPPTSTISSKPSNPTNSTSAAFAFTADESSSFQCQLDSAGFSPCSSGQSYSGLGAGSHTFQVLATDLATNSSTRSYTWTIDLTPPDTTIGAKPTSPSATTSPSFGFSSNEASSTFECRLDGAGFSGCTSAHGLSGLADGSHTFDVRATDPAGNTDATPATYTWTVDATAPTTTFSSTPSDPTGSTSASFAFAANEPATFQCRRDGGVFAACSSGQSYSGLGGGSHTFQVKATDPAGNTSTTGYTWTIDLTPPTTTFSSEPDDPTSSTSATFAFTADEPSSFQCQLDGAGFSPCATGQSYSGLAAGSHTFEARATDSVGNSSTTSYTWTVDLSPPTTTVSSKPSDPTNATSASFGFAANKASTFECRLDGGGFSACSSGQTYSGLGAGSHIFEVKATDTAGNAEATPARSTWTIDLTPPGPPTDLAGVVTADGLTLRWAPPANSDGPMGNYAVFVDGKLSSVLGGSTFEVKMGTFDAGDTRTFSVAAVDRAGNGGPQTGTLAGVPDLVGLTVPSAEDALTSRGFVLGLQTRTQSVASAGGVVISQIPSAPTLAPPGTAVAVVLGDAPVTPLPGPLLLSVTSARRVSCGPTSVLRVQVRLQGRATVNVKFFREPRKNAIATARLGIVAAGSTDLKLKLPAALGRPGRYRVLLTAAAGRETAQATVFLTVQRRHARSGEHALGCTAG